MTDLLRHLFRRHKQSLDNDKPKTDEAQSYSRDPLDPTRGVRGWNVDAKPEFKFLTVEDFPLYEVSDAALRTRAGKSIVMDSIRGYELKSAMDDAPGASGAPVGAVGQSGYAVPEALQNWYMMQGFIGYQSCAIIGQNWLVDKACSMPGEDSIRNGWELKATTENDKLADADLQTISEYDEKFKLKQNLSEFNRFKNIFGIRIALFEIDSDDPDYYEKPFNIDGVTEGSYKGISQIDPYWMMPMLTSESTSDPSSQHFYEPEYWIISGKRYHRSHLIIARGPQPADILKPTYIFGGIPLTQRIYERVYAAERTANEAPLLAMNKRTTAIHVDMEKAVLNESKFVQKLLFWIKYRDNHAVKVLGKDETMEQFDTSLADFDAVIMNQYQLVSAISKVPSTKLLGTSPKGFNATGEFEAISYHEELESIQEHVMMPLLTRHYMLLTKSLALKTSVKCVMNPVDSVSAIQRADLNDKKADTANKYITMGAVSADEVRNTLRDDKNSGFNRLSEDDGNDTPGMSPENIAAFKKAGAAEQTAGAKEEQATNPAMGQSGGSGTGGAFTPNKGAETDTTAQPAIATPERPQANSDAERAAESSVLKVLVAALHRLDEALIKEGAEPSLDNGRSTQASVHGSTLPSVHSDSMVVAGMPAYKLPKVKIGGLIAHIENPRGSVRRGSTLDGKNWSVSMPHHYGFIKGSMGADGEEMDCFIGKNLKSQNVHVINQNDKDGEFDEHKVMLGFDSAEEAKEAYHKSFGDGWDGFGSMVSCSMDDFKTWLGAGDTDQPLSENFLAKSKSFPETN